MIMKIWIDAVRFVPDGYVWCRSVNEAKMMISMYSQYFCFTDNKHFKTYDLIELIDIDHDAGDYAFDGGDYIKLLDWLEETGRSYPIHIHSMNPVGVANMRTIIKRNGWKEV